MWIALRIQPHAALFRGPAEQLTAHDLDAFRISLVRALLDVKKIAVDCRNRPSPAAWKFFDLLGKDIQVKDSPFCQRGLKFVIRIRAIEFAHMNGPRSAFHPIVRVSKAARWPMCARPAARKRHLRSNPRRQPDTNRGKKRQTQNHSLFL